MNIIPCLLDIHNEMCADGVPLGRRIAHSGKQHLWEARSGHVIDTVVIHFISATDRTVGDPFDIGEILKIFVDFGVSSHYLIDRAGIVRQLVPDEAKAWHCGGSVMPPPDLRRGVNDFSIGIELVATAESGYTDAQYASCAAVCKGLETRFGALSYVGHQDVAGAAAVALGLRGEMKPDPGPLFDWGAFHRLRHGHT